MPGAQSVFIFIAFSSLIVLYLKIDSGLCFPWSRLGDIGATNGWGILSSPSNDRHHRHPPPHRHYHHRYLSIGPRTVFEFEIRILESTLLFLISFVSKTISAAAEFYKVLLSLEFLIKSQPVYCLP